jgi:hypothetical protein
MTSFICVNTPATDDSRIVGTKYIMGFRVETTSDIKGVTPTAFRVSLRADSGSSGTLSCKLYDSSASIPTALHTFGTLDVSSIGTTFATYDFDTSPYTSGLVVGNLIGLEYSATSGTPNIWTEDIRTSDAQGTFFDYSSTSGIEFVDDRSPYYCYKAGTPAAGSGARLPPPPLVVRF